MKTIAVGRAGRLVTSTLALSALLQGTMHPAHAAETGRPRIGLALSGGGARGIAHIGVLKVLEEMRVPVDCIAGTSIGAIVGGAYASGSPAAALEKTVVATDWGTVFTDRPPREEIASRRKHDDYKTLFAPEFGLKDGSLVVPKGIIAGVSIEAYMRALTASAIGVSNFRQLPIPFRAVATDIETGEPVILDRGSVAQAMRASMAIPGAISPVEIDGRLLVDGGISNNLPIDEARKLCADVVIAVNIATPPLKREEISSAVTVAAQLINFLGKATVDRQLKSLGGRDVLIAPDLGDISAGSFERSADAIRIGEAAARAVAAALSRYSLTPAQYAALRERQVAERQGLGKVDEIRFDGLRRTNPEVLRALVHSRPGAELTEEEVSADLRRIYGRGDFESVDYRITEDGSRRVMAIQPTEKSWGPDYLRFGLGIATDFRGESYVSVLGSYRRTWLNRLGAEWLTEVKLGTNNSLFTEFYQPVDERGSWFVAPYAAASQTVRSVYSGEDRVAKYDVDETSAGLDGGSALGTWGEARLGVVWRRVSAKVDTGSPLLPELSETSAGTRLRLNADQFDNPWFPRRGYALEVNAYVADEALGSERNYKRFDGEASVATGWGPHRLQLTASGGTDARSDMPAYDVFTLGGPLRLSGYNIDEFAGRRMGFGRLLYYNRAVRLPDVLGSGVYLGGSLEIGHVSGTLDPRLNSGTVWSGSAFLAADSFLGPGYFGLGLGEGGRVSLYLLLGVP